jgi:hypothetical protein
VVVITALPQAAPVRTVVSQVATPPPTLLLELKGVRGDPTLYSLALHLATPCSTLTYSGTLVATWWHVIRFVQVQPLELVHTYDATRQLQQQRVEVQIIFTWLNLANLTSRGCTYIRRMIYH